MISAMLGLALCWLVLWACFAGLGGLLHRAVASQGAPGFANSFWLGWASWIGALEIVHFFLPLGGVAVSLPLIAAGAAGLLWHGRGWFDDVRGGLRDQPLVWIGFALFGLWLANRSLGPLLTVDAGLYHLGSIKWAAEHPLVGGLANLHGRLAFNSTAFLWMASLDDLVGALRGHEITTSLVILLAAGERIARAAGAEDERRRHFELGLLLPLAYAATVMHVSRSSPDWLVLVVGITAASLALDLFGSREEPARSQTFLALAGVAAVGVTVKLSFAAFAGSLALAVAWHVGSTHRTDRPSARAYAAAAVLVLWIAGPWLARGIELSGYPVYPFTWFGPGVEWQLPEERAQAEVDWIRSWARAPGREPAEVLGNWDWLGPWWQARFKQSESIAFFVFPGAYLLFFGMLARIRSKRAEMPSRDPRGLAIAPCWVALAAWFASAPDPRFLGAVLWIPAAWLAARPTPEKAKKTIGRAGRIAGAACLALYCAHMASTLEAWVIGSDTPRGRRVAKTKVVHTRHGIALNVPVRGQQCWEAPLPCTPYPAPRLGLRDDSEVWSGYRLIGLPHDERTKP